MVFHTIVTLLVYYLILNLSPFNPWGALVGGGLFALHPIHTHSVSYVMGRTDILAALFFLCGLILLIGTTHHKERHQQGWKIVGACFCYLLALLCKEIAITLPAIFFLYWYFWPSESRAQKYSGFLVPFFALCMTLAIYLLIRIMAVGISAPEGVIPSWYSLWQRACMVPITCGFYLWKLFSPFRLCYYSNIIVPGSWGELFKSAFFWVGILFGLSFLFSIKWAPKVSFALGWIGFTLLPVLNIILIPTLAKENFLYIPSIGFCLLLPMFIRNVWVETEKSHRRYHKFLPIPFILIGLLYTGATLRRNTDYKDPIIYLESTIRNMIPVPPLHKEDVRFFEGVKNFYVSYKNLGILYQERRQWQKSAQAFENALKYTASYFSPEYAATVKIKLGTVYDKMGYLEKASQILQEARPSANKPSKVDNLLGVISIKSGKKEQAEFYFKRAIQEDGTYAPAHYNLGLLYLEINLPQKGIEELLKATKLNPDYKRALSQHNLFSKRTGNQNKIK
jgi:tetratricopeptide (TPR) repeat protein